MFLSNKPWYLLLLFTLSSCKKEVPHITPTLKSIVESVYASGMVKSTHQYQAFGTVSGNIKTIFVKEGDIIKKGSPIMVIQNTSALLNTENAALSANYNEYNSNQDKLRLIEKEHQLARIKLHADSLMMVRQNALWAQGIGTKMEQEQRELTYQNARANLESANLRYKDLKRQLKYLSDQSKKNLKISQNNLSEYVVKSDINGRVYDILKETGEMVNQQTPLCIIGDATDFIIELEVDEYDVTKVKPGQEVIVKLDSYQDKVFEARLQRINPLMNTKSRTFTVEASFVSAPEILYPNLSLEANIVLAKKTGVLTIPVKYVNRQNYVTLKDGSLKQIKTGLRDYQIVEVTEGLDSTSQIIEAK